MRVFLIAGEASGDKLGGALMQALSELVPETTFDGVGGAQMARSGLVSRFPMSELSVMGIAEVLPKYFDLKARIRQTADAILDSQPDVLVTIDSPDFCLRVASLVRAKSNLRIVHYVAPSVWAWRSGRARKMAKTVDQVLALLPFEPPFFEEVGIRCDFVGHPIVNEPAASANEINVLRDEMGFGDTPYVLVLPGSRRTEIERLTPIFRDALGKVHKANSRLRFLVVAAPGMADRLRDMVVHCAGEPYVLATDDGNGITKRAAFAGARAALAASGTVSLELAATRTPMTIAYDMNWISWRIMSSMARIDTVTLVNLVSETRAIPEFLGPSCVPEAIAESVLDLVQSDAARDRQFAAMDTAMTRLGKGGPDPAFRAAKAILDGLNSTSA